MARDSIETRRSIFTSWVFDRWPGSGVDFCFEKSWPWVGAGVWTGLGFFCPRDFGSSSNCCGDNGCCLRLLK